MRLVLVLVTACVAVAACGGDDPAAPKTVVQVGDAAVTAEVADDEESRARGLSGRARLAPDDGMLFLLTDDSPAIWMRGMRFPIDIVWIDGGRVVDVSSDVPAPAGPNDPLPTYSPDRPASRALEVNAGWAASHDVREGDRVRVQRAPRSG